MKLSNRDIETFAALRSSETGHWLAGYCKKLQIHLCDIRNDIPGDADSRRAAADAIQKHIIDKIEIGDIVKEESVRDQYR